MINWKEHSLKEILKYESSLYFKSKGELILRNIMHAERAEIWKFQKNLRKAEYYKFKKKKIRYAIFLRKKNKIGNRIGISIHCNSFDMGLHIYHIGSIIVNGFAKIGKNCKLHGNNCIGNKGSNSFVPLIGDNVEFGYGASVYGNIKIASNSFLAAGCVAVRSINNEGEIWGGVPAKNIKMGLEQ